MIYSKVEYICNDGPSNAEVRMRYTMNNLSSKTARGGGLEEYTPYHHYPVHPTRQVGTHNNGNNNHQPHFSRHTYRDDYSGLKLVRGKKKKNDEV